MNHLSQAATQATIAQIRLNTRRELEERRRAAEERLRGIEEDEAKNGVTELTRAGWERTFRHIQSLDELAAEAPRALPKVSVLRKIRSILTPVIIWPILALLIPLVALGVLGLLIMVVHHSTGALIIMAAITTSPMIAGAVQLAGIVVAFLRFAASREQLYSELVERPIGPWRWHWVRG